MAEVELDIVANVDIAKLMEAQHCQKSYRIYKLKDVQNMPQVVYEGHERNDSEIIGGTA